MLNLMPMILAYIPRKSIGRGDRRGNYY